MSRKINEVYKLLKEDSSYKTRMKNLENAGEFGYAILILWTRIEITLKLLKYQDQKADYPDKLDFIHGNWKVLKNAKEHHTEAYNIIINKKNPKSLWNKRNIIVHTSCNIDKDLFEEYKKHGYVFLNIISQNLLPISKVQRRRTKTKKKIN